MVDPGRLANSVHCPSFASFPDVELVAIADIDDAALTSTADRFGISGHSSDCGRIVSAMKPDGAFDIGRP